MFNLNHWFWFVGQDESQVFSSAVGAFIPVDDSNFIEWLSSGNLPTHISDNQELADVLTRQAPAASVVALISLAKMKELKRVEINATFEQSMQQITSGYPSNEVSSWAKQETEARAYVANNSAATPLLDALASSRSVNKAELVTRIIAKADLFAGISGTLIGRCQGLEDDLDALSATATAEDVAAIVW